MHVSNEEIMERFKKIDLLRKEKEGNFEKQIIQLQNKIVEDLYFLVYNNAKQYYKFPNYDDLVQEGYVGLIKATRRFNYKRFPNFFVYARQWILNGIKRSAKKFDVVYNPNKSKTLYINNDAVFQEFVDLEMDLENMMITKETCDKTQQVINSLPSREQLIIKSVFGVNEEQHTLRETEKCCGVSYERVRQIKNKIIERLKTCSAINDLQ